MRDAADGRLLATSPCRHQEGQCHRDLMVLSVHAGCPLVTGWTCAYRPLDTENTKFKKVDSCTRLGRALASSLASWLRQSCDPTTASQLEALVGL